MTGAATSAGGPPMSARLASATVIKGMIGSGVLSLPYFCGKVGLSVSAPGMLVTSFLGAFSIWRLIECKDMLQTRAAPAQSGAGSRSFDGPSPFGLGPMAAVAYSSFGIVGMLVAGFGVIVTQLSLAVSYVDVIVETVTSPSLLGDEFSRLRVRAVLCLILCSLNLVRKLGSLAWLSVLGLALYMYLFAALAYFGAGEIASGEAPEVHDVWLRARMDNFGLWFGSAIFAQEAIILSQYVYDDMRVTHRKQFLPVLVTSFSVGAILYVLVGAFGYASYGDRVSAVFYLSFPPGSAAVVAGEITLCLVLLLSHAVQMFPVMGFLEATVLGIGPDVSDEKASAAQHGGGVPAAAGEASLEVEEARNHTGEEPVKFSRGHPNLIPTTMLRFAAVAAASAIEAVVPNLACVTGYGGCFAMSIVCFFVPGLCHICLLRGNWTFWQMLGDLMLLAAGCAAVFFGVTSVSC